MSQEIELKLSLPRSALPALRRHPLIAGAPKEGRAATLDNTYFDTPQLDLRSRRVAVRTRRQGRQMLQTIKCAAVSTGGLSQRPEWEAPYVGCFDYSAVDIPEVAKLLRRHDEKLVPVFSTRFRRETRRYMPRDGVCILIMIDSGSIEAGERSAPICELELELVAGKPADLLELACTLAQNLPLMPGDVSKAQRGYQLFVEEPLRPTLAEAVALTAHQTVIEAFRELAQSCLRQWQANAVAVADGIDGPEFVHQLRVALRRLRSLIKLFAPALPAEFVADWSARLRELAGRFGASRDLDVLHLELIAPVEPQGLDDAFDGGFAALQTIVEQARSEARASALDQLRHSGQGHMMLEFSLALHRLPTGKLMEAADLRTFARLQLSHLRKRARRRHEAAATLVPTRLHALRIALKRLRYGIEFLGALFPARAVDRYRKQLAKAQTTLGFLHDLDVARGALESWTGSRSDLLTAAAFVIGWHSPRYARSRRRALAEAAPLLWGKTPW